jgi:hypothetical protein
MFPESSRVPAALLANGRGGAWSVCHQENVMIAEGCAHLKGLSELHTVVGVLPASFDFASVFAPGSRFDLYFPFPLSPETNRWGNTMAMIGRLEPGSTREP